MSGADEPFDADSMDGSPPDLFAGIPGWESPLPDLTDVAAGGDDAREAAGGAHPDQEHAGRNAGGVPHGDAPPVHLEDRGATGVLPDLTKSAASAPPSASASTAGASPPDPTWSAVSAPQDLVESASGAALPDLGGDDADDLWAPGPQAAPQDAEDGEEDASLPDLARRPRRSRRGRRRPPSAGPVAEALTAARDLGSPSGTGSAGDASTPVEPRHEPRGLATGGPIGGLEPGTLFGPAAGDLPSAMGTRGRKPRRGRRRRGEQTPSSDAATPEPERPLTAEERLQHALKLAYQHLTKRDRTVSEVRAHLEKREVDEASIAGALAELVEFRYLDDERYASRYVEDKRRLEGWGHLRIEQGLRRTGVPREVADRAVAADPLRGDEAELAVETLQQRLNGRAPGDDRGRQKALRLLATKGYALETAYEAVRTYERRCAERDDD